MTIEISPAWVTAGCTVATLLGGGLVKWLADRDADQEKRFNEQIARIEEKYKRELQLLDKAHAELGERFNARLAAAKEDVRASDRRLALLERDYISRADHAQFRAEMTQAIKDIGQQLTHGLELLGSKMEGIVGRVAVLEGAGK